MKAERKKLNVMVVFGTRPEAIKLAPVILELAKTDSMTVTKVSTRQHREMLQQVLDLFAIVPDHDLQIMQPNQSLTHIVEKTAAGLKDLFSLQRPDLLIIQGDTTTAFMAALTAFYHKIPVAHVEAGLRTFNRFAPYPEEANRRMISCIADYHFAPTEGNKDNLLRENIDAATILVTGNTVIDALHFILQRYPGGTWVETICPPQARLILVTAHRRENFGQPLKNICQALIEIVRRFEDVHIVYPVHLNENVHQPVHAMLGPIDRIHLLPPVEYHHLAALMQRAHIVLTDSGGIQEEAPSLARPVVVLREETERPEAVTAGTVVIGGTSIEGILRPTILLLTDPVAYHRMAQAVNPYGDGKAAQRIVRFIKEKFNL